jgi:hypothetical protein
MFFYSNKPGRLMTGEIRRISRGSFGNDELQNVLARGGLESTDHYGMVMHLTLKPA